jgi:CubicO group peptidase (beta-lactamase class C family)/transglutaminase-like putative cysteine protease
MIMFRTVCSWGFWLAVACVPLNPASARPDDDNAQTLERARQAASAGRFSVAETLLRETITDASVVDGAAEQLEILRRIRLDYSLTTGQVLAQLRENIPEVTEKDLDAWREQGVLQHRVIDGEIRYFNRAVGNLFRACPAAKARCRNPVDPKKTFDLPAHLAKLVAVAEQTGQVQVHPVQHRVRYTLRVKEGNPRLQKGAKVRCWLPFPQDYRQQGQVHLLSAEPVSAAVAPNGCAQRTAYFEQTVDDPAKPPEFAAEFEFVTAAYMPQLDPFQVKPYDIDGELYRRYTAERPPHIVFTPEVKILAGEIVGDETNPLEKALRIFRWVSKEIRWCAEAEYSTIPNLSAKGIAAREGDCGVQGLAFITLCRAAGVPARWQSGWQTKPDRVNMHDWSEFYVEPWGWLPADASNGLQKHEDPRVREFFCGHLDPYRFIVNLDYARELDPPKQSFRSEPNDFQRGEVEIDGQNLYFDEWQYTIDVRTMPLDGGMASLEEALDAVVPKELKAGKVAGAVIAVGRRTATGYETWQKAYGLAQAQAQPQRALMPVDAVFDMASMTKPIATGTSLMILVEQGRVAVDDPVAKYLPEFDTEKKKGVTIRHLMTHTSGMPPYVGATERKPIQDKAGFPCPAAIRQYIRELPLSTEPGKRVVYSCLNAILCAEVIQTVSGQPLDEFATEHVFKPLGMHDSGFNPAPPVRARCLVTTREPYATGPDGFLQGEVHDPLAAMQGGVSGNAGLFSTAADLSRFAQMLLNGGELDGTRILKERTIGDMTRIQNPDAVSKSGVPDRRGLLWDLYVPKPGDTGLDALTAYGHTGYTGTAIRVYPEQGVYVIALTNRVHPDDTSKVGDIRARVWETAGAVLMGTPAFGGR